MLTIAPGNMTGSFTVVVTDDSIDELDVERFGVALGTAVNATVDDGTAVVGITDNDLAPVVSVQGPSPLSEGRGPCGVHGVAGRGERLGCVGGLWDKLAANRLPRQLMRISRKLAGR